MAASRSPQKRGRKQTSCIRCHKRKKKCDGAQPCSHCKHDKVSPCTYVGGHMPYSVQNNHPYSPMPDSTTRRQPGVSSSASSTPTPKPQQPKQTPAFNWVPQYELYTIPANRAGGDIWKQRDGASFFGSSFFGPQAAARYIDGPSSMDADLPSGLDPARNGPLPNLLNYCPRPFRSEPGGISELWELLGMLPRQKVRIERIIEAFLREYNTHCELVDRTFLQETTSFFQTNFLDLESLRGIDLRWLSVLFIVLALGVLLDVEPSPTLMSIQDRHEASSSWYWATRRCMSLSSYFYGESLDIVRAYALATRWLLHGRRVSEAWSTIGFGIRVAQAQGFHVDGETLGLEEAETEQRRRLWAHLFCLDAELSLALGRPPAIDPNSKYHPQSPSGVLRLASDLEDRVSPTDAPSRSLYLVCRRSLAAIINRIQAECFAVGTSSKSISYDLVAALDKELEQWAEKLPHCFKLENPDTAYDSKAPYLVHQRRSVWAEFYFARVTLHRPHVLRGNVDERFKQSQIICISCARKDVQIRLEVLKLPPLDRFKWAVGPVPFFSATVLGVVAVSDPFGPLADQLLQELNAYTKLQKQAVLWNDQFLAQEIKVLDLCIERALEFRKRCARETNLSAQPSSEGGNPLQLLIDASSFGGNNNNDSSRNAHVNAPPGNADVNSDPNPNGGANNGVFQQQIPMTIHTPISPTSLQGRQPMDGMMAGVPPGAPVIDGNNIPPNLQNSAPSTSTSTAATTSTSGRIFPGYQNADMRDHQQQQQQHPQPNGINPSLPNYSFNDAFSEAVVFPSPLDYPNWEELINTFLAPGG